VDTGWQLDLARKTLVRGEHAVRLSQLLAWRAVALKRGSAGPQTVAPFVRRGQAQAAAVGAELPHGQRDIV